MFSLYSLQIDKLLNDENFRKLLIKEICLDERVKEAEIIINEITNKKSTRINLIDTDTNIKDSERIAQEILKTKLFDTMKKRNIKDTSTICPVCSTSFDSQLVFCPNCGFQWK